MLLTIILIFFCRPSFLLFFIIRKGGREKRQHNIKNHMHTLELSSVLPFVVGDEMKSRRKASRQGNYFDTNSISQNLHIKIE
jgi:hypothetical protein